MYLLHGTLKNSKIATIDKIDTKNIRVHDNHSILRKVNPTSLHFTKINSTSPHFIYTMQQILHKNIQAIVCRV